MMSNKIKYSVILFLIPFTIIIGVILLNDRKYSLISLLVAILACIPFLYSFENSHGNTRKMVIIAALVAISVSGRFIFAPTPGFKPVTAVVVITGMYFGYEAGFLTGALSALISNIYFGQGPWTPFQMFTWGIIGFLAGLPLVRKKLHNKIFLILYGIFAGVIYSLVMDIWTVMAMDGTYNATRYLAAVIASLPFMAIYAVSNVFFLLIAIKPIGEKLERIKVKYGI